jgi:hypothetical protein
MKRQMNGDTWRISGASKSRSGALRLPNPTPPVQPILERTRMRRIFETVKE